MNSLLARFAESTFWLARYMERVENLARFLQVNETFSRDPQGVNDWRPIVGLHVDEERFFAAHASATADAVIDFYVIDGANPGSILSMAQAARENARALRHLISTEMWMQINVFYNQIAALRHRDVSLSKLAGLCAWIKEGCQAHFGITEGTLYRDQVWCFYAAGKYLERADMTSRLLDVRYHQLLGADAEERPVVDVSQWNALLRFVAGYQAFRRTHPRVVDPDDVARFLVFEERFPRSIIACIGQVERVTAALATDFGLSSGAVARDVAALAGMLAHRSLAEVHKEGLHAFSDRIQRQVNALTGDLGRAFFARDVGAVQ